MNKFTSLIIIVCCFLATACDTKLDPSKKTTVIKEGALEGNFKPTKIIPASPELLAHGKRVYEQQCSACHGADGQGQGEAAYLLYPKPRNLVDAQYRFVSTWDRKPTDEDLYFSISRGIPGSAMPSWYYLPEETRWALVHYIKSFSPGGIPQITKETEGSSGIIKIPPEPPYTPEARARAIEVFTEACASCHGKSGRGDGFQKLTDNSGFPIRARDFTQGIFKGGADPEAIYRRIITGIPGTPMPKNDWAYGDDAWHLTHWILSLSVPQQREKVEMKKFSIVAHYSEEIPTHPDAGVWRDTSGVELHLMPMWWRDDRPEILSVKALHNGKEVALRLVWNDATYDHTAIRAQDYRDAAAIQFSKENDPPFFAMGEKGKFVNIWMWKSERQADIGPGFQDIETVYPNVGIDSYPNLQHSALEQPARQALTLESDPTFVTGWGAKNIVSDPKRKSAVEDLTAQGFGTLKARMPYPFDTSVQAKGIYDMGTYRVVLRRNFEGQGGKAITFSPGKVIPVAFAIWNGSAGDRDGKKSVTIWQDLVIAK